MSTEHLTEHTPYDKAMSDAVWVAELDFTKPQAGGLNTQDEISSSALVKGEDRELTYVINRHLVQP